MRTTRHNNNNNNDDEDELDIEEFELCCSPTPPLPLVCLRERRGHQGTIINDNGRHHQNHN